MAKITPIIMDPKYAALQTLVTVLYVGAGVLVLSGFIFLSTMSNSGMLALAPLIFCCVLAFNFVVMAQIIKVFIDMEWNQRETNELLEQVIKNLPEGKND